MAGGQQLGSVGSCLNYTESMFIECNGRDSGTRRIDAGECQMFSDKYNYWIYNFNGYKGGGVTFDGSKVNMKDYISTCRVCVGRS